MIIRVMVAVSEPVQRSRLERLASGPGSVAISAGSVSRLWEQLRGSDVDAVVIDRSTLPHDPTGWLAEIAGLPERPDVIVAVEQEDAEDRARLLAAGAMAVLLTGLDDEPLKAALLGLLDRRRARELASGLVMRPDERRGLSDFVAVSDAMTAFMTVTRRVATSQSSILILGETGSGKERLARALHTESLRSEGPFVAVNCGALTETLLEAELFGHEQGAFTGATRSRRGYFELAHGGTLFLDEIGEVPLHLQVKLLRALEERVIRRVGSEQTIPVDTRILAATNRRLDEEVAAGRFRPDLYYRLAVVTLTVPALRERRDDIPELVTMYFDRFRNRTPGCTATRVSPEAMEAMRLYDWPGNVRELINVIERSVLLCGSDAIEVSDLPPAISGDGVPAGPTARLKIDDALLGAPLGQARRQMVRTFEHAYLRRLLSRSHGRIKDAAGHAGVDERSIYNLMRRHGLRKEQFKPKPRRSRKR